MITAERGGSIQIQFHVAINSVGDLETTSRDAVFSFTNEEGFMSSLNTSFSVDDFDFPQYYSLSIESVQETDAGVYSVQALGKEI